MTTSENQVTNSNKSQKIIKFAFIAAFAVAIIVIYKLQSRDLSIPGWLNNAQAALTKAKKENRKVCLLFVSSPPSQISRDLKDQLLHPGAIRKVKELNYIGCVIPNKNSNQAIIKKFNIKKFPTLIALDPDGSIRNRHEGYIAQVPFRQEFLVDTLSKKVK